MFRGSVGRYGAEVEERDRISCEEAELFASMALDDECGEENLRRLRDHLRECSDCRAMAAELSSACDMVAYLAAARHTPSAPDVGERGAWEKAAPILRYLKPIAYAAAAMALFLGGSYYGRSQAEERFSALASLSPAYVVTTPTMWLSTRPGAKNSDIRVSPEKPFTDSIERYRAVIVKALQAEDVNWMEIRRLVEAMGELRTDIELLTLHMAYLDIRTGEPGRDVAAHWERLGRSFQMGGERSVAP